MTRSRTALGATAAAGLLLAIALGGCQLPGAADQASPPQPSPAAATQIPFDSQFTHDGTFQSHVSVPDAKGMDFVFTLYPTKSTPRTNEWYPQGKKYFSFTFQAYDLDQDLRAPFATKRKVWMSNINVTSATVTDNGGATQSPYALDSKAPRITFDPQPLTNRYGMLVTSPKGAFELRNQAIGPVSSDTRGINLTMTATVWVETAAGSGHYVEHEVKQVVPIAIFASKQATSAAPIPVDAN